MNYPNKIYICEYKGENQFGGDCHFVITVAASDSNTAREYVKEKIGIDVSPVWLMDASYPTIYTSNGSLPEMKQARILYNANYHTYDKRKT